MRRMIKKSDAESRNAENTARGTWIFFQIGSSQLTNAISGCQLGAAHALIKTQGVRNDIESK